MLSGFGSIPLITDVFYIPTIEICNGKESIIFTDFYLPVVNRGNFGTDLIIPSSMFKNSNIFLSQLELLENQKKLFIQYQAKFYKVQYTVRRLTATGIATLRKICKDHNITVDTRIIGGEGEFYKVLTQEGLNRVMEKADQDNENISSNFLKETISDASIEKSSSAMSKMNVFSDLI